MRIRVTRQPAGTVDGIDLSKLVQGNVYDLSAALASLLIVSDWAELVIDDAPGRPNGADKQAAAAPGGTADDQSRRRVRPRAAIDAGRGAEPPR